MSLEKVLFFAACTYYFCTIAFSVPICVLFCHLLAVIQPYLQTIAIRWQQELTTLSFQASLVLCMVLTVTARNDHVDSMATA